MAFVCVTCPRICCSVRQHVYGAYLFVISASGRSIVQRSPTECDVSEYDPASSILRGPWPTGGCCGMAKISTVSVGAAPCHPTLHVRARSKRDGTRAETRFRLSEKRTSPFKSAWGSVQSTTGSRGVRISGSNAGYTMFRGTVQDYWLPTPLACFPFTPITVRHCLPSGFN